MKNYLKYITTIILLLVLFNTIKSVNSLSNSTDRIKNAKSELEEVKKENLRIKAQIDEAKTAKFIENAAIEKLNLAKANERILIMHFSDEKTEASSKETKPVKAATIPQKWAKFMHLELIYYTFAEIYLWGA